MKCMILAAGYATRLYPLTENFPKPLLPVAGEPILDHLIRDMSLSGEIDEYIVISNHKYVSHFREWAKQSPHPITVLDDGTESNETRLGAVRDMHFALQELSLDDDVLCIAGDNLLSFSLVEFIRYAKEKAAPCTMRYYEESEKRLKKSGVVTVDENDLVLKMTEKSPEPETHWVSPAFYYYRAEDLKMIPEAIENGCGVDAPGSFFAWLSRKEKAYAMEMPGKRFDIGDIESYEKVKQIFEKNW